MSVIEPCAQIGQDQWVIELFGKKTAGFFLDIGASDGISINNTFYLERKFAWQGICFEPGAKFPELQKNRLVKVSDACLYKEAGDLVNFNIATENNDFSGIKDHLRNKDAERLEYKTVKKVTQTLTNCLQQFNAPKSIEYMSLDTEGSELEILQGLDFNEFSISAITVEHNFEEPKRSLIKHLLESNGYKRIRTVEYDDWYVLPQKINSVRLLLQRCKQVAAYLSQGVRNRLRPSA